MLIFFPQKCVFYQIKIRRTMLKQPIRIEYLFKQKPRGALALQIEEKGLLEEVSSFQYFFYMLVLVI